MMSTTFPGWPADGLEKTIYAETDPSQLAEILHHFLDELPGRIRHQAAEHVMSVIQEAWNYLPHKRLGNRTPADVMAAELPR
jgi:hypothetical protein